MDRLAKTPARGRIRGRQWTTDGQKDRTEFSCRVSQGFAKIKRSCNVVSDEGRRKR